MLNMGLHALLMIYGWAFAKWSPLGFIVSFVVFHVFIAAQGVREPHITTLIHAWAESRKTTKNLVKTRNKKKYVP